MTNLSQNGPRRIPVNHKTKGNNNKKEFEKAEKKGENNILLHQKRNSSSQKKIIVLLVAAVLLAVSTLTLSLRMISLQRNLADAKESVSQLNLENVSLQEQLDLFLSAKPLQTNGDATNLSYQELYPELYAELPDSFTQPPAKTVYLTFDDGPSGNTDKILDILDEYSAKATFFVVGENIAGREDTLRKIVSRGHALAIHTDTHVYSDIYASVEAYLADFNAVYEKIVEATGEQPGLFRFPGGSVNAYNKLLYQQIIAEMTRRGFLYYDWNVDSGDASGNKIPADDIVKRVYETIKSDYSVVLLHDAAAKKTTAEALPKILKQLQEQGYTFAALDNTVPPPQFGYSS